MICCILPRVTSPDIRIILMCFQQPAQPSHAHARVVVPLLGLGLGLRLRLVLPKQLVRHNIAVQCAHCLFVPLTRLGVGGLVAAVAAVWSL